MSTIDIRSVHIVIFFNSDTNIVLFGSSSDVNSDFFQSYEYFCFNNFQAHHRAPAIHAVRCQYAFLLGTIIISKNGLSPFAQCRSVHLELRQELL